MCHGAPSVNKPVCSQCRPAKDHQAEPHWVHNLTRRETTRQQDRGAFQQEGCEEGPAPWPVLADWDVVGECGAFLLWSGYHLEAGLTLWIGVLTDLLQKEGGVK